MAAEKIFEPARFYHLGIVVRSVDETVKFYEQVLGLGPFQIREANYPTATYMGGKGGYRGKRAFGKMGPVMLELMEHLEGKTVHEAFLNEKGEGLHHIGFQVSNMKESIAAAERLGLKVTQSFDREKEDGSGFAYLDSDQIGGVVFEVVGGWDTERDNWEVP